MLILITLAAATIFHANSSYSLPQYIDGSVYGSLSKKKEVHYYSIKKVGKMSFFVPTGILEAKFTFSVAVWGMTGKCNGVGFSKRWMIPSYVR